MVLAVEEVDSHRKYAPGRDGSSFWGLCVSRTVGLVTVKELHLLNHNKGTVEQNPRFP